MWVSYVEFMAQRTKRIIGNKDQENLDSSKKQIYRVDTLFDVEALWNHLLVSLYRKTGHKTLFKYYSHAWLQLGRNAEELEFYERLRKSGIECHWIFGNDTPLDRIGAARVGRVFPAVTTRNAPFPEDG